MPDGRRLFVYLAEHYGMGLGYFHEGEWRTAWSPRARDALHRPPRPARSWARRAAVQARPLPSSSKLGPAATYSRVITHHQRVAGIATRPARPRRLRRLEPLAADPRSALTVTAAVPGRSRGRRGPTHDGGGRTGGCKRRVDPRRWPRAAGDAPCRALRLRPVPPGAALDRSSVVCSSRSTPGARATASPFPTPSTRTASSPRRRSTPTGRWRALSCSSAAGSRRPWPPGRRGCT
jgi:hypothetical protein